MYTKDTSSTFSEYYGLIDIFENASLTVPTLEMVVDTTQKNYQGVLTLPSCP